MEIAQIVSKRSTCKRRSVGALVVKEKRILSTGYNGAPMGLKHCIEIGCLREKLNIASGERHELCRGLHAEQNAIIQAAFHGVSINGADIYSTHLPCSICIKMIINAGITRVFYTNGYPDNLSMEMMDESGINLVRVDMDVNLESERQLTDYRNLESYNTKLKAKNTKPRSTKKL